MHVVNTQQYGLVSYGLLAFNTCLCVLGALQAWQELNPSGTPPSVREGHAAVWSDAVDGFYSFGGWGL